MDIACFFLLRALIFILGKTFKEIIELLLHVLFQFAVEWKLFDFTNFLSTQAFDNFVHMRRNSAETDDLFLDTASLKENNHEEKVNVFEKKGAVTASQCEERAVEIIDKKSDLSDISQPAKTIEIKLDIMKDYSSNIQLGIGRREKEKQVGTVETEKVVAVNENVLNKNHVIQIQSNDDAKKHFKEVCIKINALKCDSIKYPDKKVKIKHRFAPLTGSNPPFKSANPNMDSQINDQFFSNTDLNARVKYADLNVNSQSIDPFPSKKSLDFDLKSKALNIDPQLNELLNKTDFYSKAKYADLNAELGNDDQLFHKIDLDYRAKDEDSSYAYSAKDGQFSFKDSELDVFGELGKKHEDTKFPSFAEKLKLFNEVLSNKSKNIPTQPVNLFNDPFKGTLRDPIYDEGRRHFEETKSFFLQKNASNDRFIDRNESPCVFELLDRKISGKSDSVLENKSSKKHVTFWDTVVRNDRPVKKKLSGDFDRIGTKIHDLLKKIEDREAADVTMDENRKKMYLDLDRIKATRTFSFQQARSTFERHI